LVKKAPSHPYACGELEHGFALSTTSKAFANIAALFTNSFAFAFCINPFVLSCIGYLGFFTKLFDECFISIMMFRV
jgi:hypothetical protein